MISKYFFIRLIYIVYIVLEMEYFQNLGINPQTVYFILFILLCVFLSNQNNLFSNLINNSNDTNNNTNGKYQTQWINTGFGYGYGDMNPADRLPDIIKQFGPPKMFDPTSGGSAIWTKEQLTNTPYERIEIRDEQIPHDKPKPHTDFLYSWYKIDIPSYKIGGLHKISKSISYDPLKKVMTARCHDMRPNVVTHWIVKQYAEDRLTIDEAVGMYGPMILELFQNDPLGDKYMQLYSEL